MEHDKDVERLRCVALNIGLTLYALALVVFALTLSLLISEWRQTESVTVQTFTLLTRGLMVIAFPGTMVGCGLQLRSHAKRLRPSTQM